MEDIIRSFEFNKSIMILWYSTQQFGLLTIPWIGITMDDPTPLRMKSVELRVTISNTATDAAGLVMFA